MRDTTVEMDKAAVIPVAVVARAALALTLLEHKTDPAGSV